MTDDDRPPGRRRTSRMTIRVYQAGTEGGEPAQVVRQRDPTMVPISPFAWEACVCPRCTRHSS
ncbi:hypothetical protein [Yinghuangia soli]|uniref:Uncharacterized protein n=1 Tax=Yinghuangia soli TaxID=2908204 RepID=A0AA41PVC6_9ACTN|nr:hypothetical protein [Yinghuangia soli]MCF2526549.1 hypothetical protein [Yinghuangia soli]